MPNPQFEALDAYGELSLHILALGDQYRRTLSKLKPGSVDYEQASGALFVIDHLTDRATELLIAPPVQAEPPAAASNVVQFAPRARTVAQPTGGSAA